MKYTPDQLRQMARQHLAAKTLGDERCMQVVIALFMKLGLTPQESEAEIRRLAQ